MADVVSGTILPVCGLLDGNSPTMRQWDCISCSTQLLTKRRLICQSINRFSDKEKLLLSSFAERKCTSLNCGFGLARRSRNRFPQSICFNRLAHVHLSEIDSRKVDKVGRRKGGKSRTRNGDDSEIEATSSNELDPSTISMDGRHETVYADHPLAKTSKKKKQMTAARESGQSTGSKLSINGRTGKKNEELSVLTLDGESPHEELDCHIGFQSREKHEGPINVENNIADASKVDSGARGLQLGEREPEQPLAGTRQIDDAAGKELDLRLLFMESIMYRARGGDVDGVEEAISEMEIAGLHPGPRAYHALVVSYTRARDAEGAVRALQKELVAVERPVPETFVAMTRLFGTLGQGQRGEEILAIMEELQQEPRFAWAVLVEELRQAGYLQDANDVFFKGADGGLTGDPHLYNALIEENSRVGDHGSAFNIMRSLEYAGFQPTTLHYNCLLMCQANADAPEIAASTLEEMKYGHEKMKPDAESYNWVLQAYIRNIHGDRLQEVVDLVGEMVEDHKRVQPNRRTYSLLVECFTKYNVVNESVRHFRALRQIPGGMPALHNGGRYGDPMSLYLRSLCLEGRAIDLLEALDGMVRDKQEISPRAMIVNQKGRTLVSSWIEPIGAEADLGHEVDYITRYVAEGGSAGTRKRWSDQESRSEDSEGFRFSAPVEVSFKQHCAQMRRRYLLKLIRKLRAEGALALGPGATDEIVGKIMAKLRKETIGDMVLQQKKPKAASKMVVSELKEELEAQGLPTDGTRPVLYQRVQKARRINRARGRPLWVPDTEVVERVQEAEDHSTDVFMDRLNLENDHTDFWRKRLSGELQDTELFQQAGDELDTTVVTESLESDSGDDEEDDDDENEDDVEEETEEIEDLTEDGAQDEDPEAPELLALKLMKKKPEASADDKDPDDEGYKGQWSGLTFQQKITKLRTEKILDPTEMYTIADVWGWSWERDIRTKEPIPWTRELEVEIGLQIMQRVLELGSCPTVGDCAVLMHAAMQTSQPEHVVNLIQQAHRLGFKFGSKLYMEVLERFITGGEQEAAVRVMTSMEGVGIKLPTDAVETALIQSAKEAVQDLPSPSSSSIFTN